MKARLERLLRAPWGVPNALQRVSEGLWIADQITDRVALVEVGPPGDYGVTRWLREIPTDSSNTSGMAYGEGALWLAANGPGTLWRPARPADAAPGSGAILKVDPASGKTLMRRPVPGGGGVHGIEYDHEEPGHLWVTTLKQQTLSQVRIADWQVVHAIRLPHGRAHGVVRSGRGVWVVHTSDRILVHLDVRDGRELERVTVPAGEPEPHGLTAWEGDDLAYCDATSGWVVRVSGA